MVLIKATFQNVLRRFSAADGLSIVNMKSKLKEIFPELSAISSDTIELYYKDSDNDLISVSSDEELHTAEQTVGEDKTIKLLIDVSEKQNEEEDLLDATGSFFSHLPFFSHISSPFSHLSNMFGQIGDPFSFAGYPPSWSDRKKMMERHEDCIRRQRIYEENMRKAHLESIKKMKDKAIAEDKKMAAEEPSTCSTEVKRRSSKEFKPVLPAFPPGWHVTPYGAWEPVVYRTPYGTRRVWGPWGYTASYGDEEEMEKGEKIEEKMEEEKKEEKMEDEKKEEKMEDEKKEEKMEEKKEAKMDEEPEASS